MPGYTAEEEARVALNMTTHLSEPDMSGYPPMLSSALNCDMHGDPPEEDLPVTSDDTMKQMLRTIEERLDAGLDEAWNSSAGNPGKMWDPSDPEEKWARAISEMLYATNYGGPAVQYFGYFAGSVPWNSYIFLRVTPRWTAEPQFQNGRIKLRPDYYLYWRAIDKIDWGVSDDDPSLSSGRNSDPASSLYCACQHLCTYGVVTRGHDWFKVMGGEIGASRDSIGLPMFGKQYDGAGPPPVSGWSPRPPSTSDVSDVSNAVAAGGYGPGSVYIFDPFMFHRKVTLYINDEDKKKFSDDEKQTQEWIYQQHLQATGNYVGNGSEWTKPERGTPFDHAVGGEQRYPCHAEFVLRVHPKKTRAQLFNTAMYGLDFRKRDGFGSDATRMRLLSKVGWALGGNYNCDGPFFGSVPGPSCLCGVAHAQGGDTDPQRLAESTDAMQRARPVGVARLVVAQYGARKAHYVSRMLPMWGPKPNQNYHIARLIWSVRNLPGRQNLQAYWLIYIPLNNFAYTLWKNGARSTAQGELWRRGWTIANVDRIRCVTHTRAGQAYIEPNPPAFITDAAKNLPFASDYYDPMQSLPDPVNPSQPVPGFSPTPEELPYFYAPIPAPIPYVNG